AVSLLSTAESSYAESSGLMRAAGSPGRWVRDNLLTRPYRGFGSLWTRTHPRSGTPLANTAPSRGGPGRTLERVQNRVDQPVLHRRLGGQDLVPLDVPADLFGGFAGILGNHPLQQRPHPQDLVRLDLDVGRLAVALLGGRLMDE